MKKLGFSLSGKRRPYGAQELEYGDFAEVATAASGESGIL